MLVPSITEFDRFSKRPIDMVDLYDVRTTFEMEEMKHTTALPLHHVTIA